MDVRSFARARRVAESATATWRASHIAIAIWILAVAARLVLINQPYVDHWSWRQSDVAAIARNFYEGGFRFAYPQIDWAGDATGYVGTEFPILPFLTAICYKVAGIHEWIGRSQAVIFFAVSLPLFYLAVAGIGDPGRREIKLVTIRDRRSRLQLLLFAALAVLPSVAWYWHAYQIAQRFYPYHLFGAGGIRIENFSWYWAIARETMISSLTPVLAIIALVGLFVAPRLRCTAGRLRSKYSALFHW